MRKHKRVLVLGLIIELIYLTIFLNHQKQTICLWLLATAFLFFLIASFFNWEKIPLQYLFGFVILFSITAMFIWELFSDDLMTYIYRGRTLSHYQQNPYLVPYDNFPEDVFYPRLKNIWSKRTTVYGPVVIVLCATLTFLGGNHLLLTILLFKTVFAATFILSAWLVYKITQSKQALFLYSWNPVIIIELVADAHNEALMILFLLLGLLTATQLKGWFFMTLSGLTKFLTFVLAPFWLIYSLSQIKTSKQKAWFLILGIIISLLVTTIFYAPFWESPEILTRLFQMHRSTTLVASPAVIIFSQPTSRLIFKFAFGITLLCFLRQRKTKKVLFNYLGVAYSLFLVFYLGLLMPWYLTTLIALLSLRQSRVSFLVSGWSLTLHYYLVLIA